MRTLIPLGLAGATVLVLAFQNCSENLQPAETPAQGKTVIGNSAGYTKIVFDAHLEYRGPDGSVRLEADLEAGRLTVGITGRGSKSCALDQPRLNQLKELMARSKVCKPGPLPPDTAVCMAIGIADIELSNDTSSVQLRPVICHNGVYLCDGADEILRALLADLRTNVPPGCN